jgi:Tfp pilus assembly protein PilO
MFTYEYLDPLRLLRSLLAFILVVGTLYCICLSSHLSHAELLKGKDSNLLLLYSQCQVHSLAHRKLNKHLLN